MGNIKQNNRFVFRNINLLQVIMFFFILASGVNAQDTAKVVAVELVRMNVFYTRFDNPVKIAVSGIESSELEVATDNGTIIGEKGEFIIKPKEVGFLTLTVKHRGKEIQKTKFRVSHGFNVVVVLKNTPPNCFELSSKMFISSILEAGGIKVVAENSDFDLKYDIVCFTISSSKNDSIKAVSKSGEFTDEQKAIISGASVNDRILIEDILVKMYDINDETAYFMPSLIFKIIGK